MSDEKIWLQGADVDGRVLQRRGEDAEDLQLRGADSRPARDAEERAAPGAVRGPPVRRVRPSSGAGAAGRLAVAGGPRRHRVVLRDLHDLRLPAWPRVSITARYNRAYIADDAPDGKLVTIFFPCCHRLPGRSFASNEHVWLCNAHLAGSKAFPRALLAKVCMHVSQF